MSVSRTSGIEYQILHRGTFAMLQVGLKRSETFQAEGGAMVCMSDTIELFGHMDNFYDAAMRRMAGESFMFQRYRARDNGVLFLAPGLPGDIAVLDMDGSEDFKLTRNAYMASTPNIRIQANPLQAGNVSMSNLLGNRLNCPILLNVTGRGTVFMSSCGAISCIELKDTEEFIVDNGHMVAWPSFMRVEIERAQNSQDGGSFVKDLANSYFSGEGLVYHAYGPGKLYFQSRNIDGTREFIRSFL